jgi:hypothetical protein
MQLTVLFEENIPVFIRCPTIFWPDNPDGDAPRWQLSLQKEFEQALLENNRQFF